MAMICDAEGDQAASLQAYEESLRIKRRIADDHPDNAEYRCDVAMSHHNIGILRHRFGKLAEALVSHQSALAIRSSLAAANPGVTHFQRDLANGLNETGDVLRSLGRTAEARLSHEQARKILEDLLEKNPSVTDSQVWLVQSLKGLGASDQSEGRTADAVAKWRRAVAIGESLRSNKGETLYYLAGCHALLGGLAGASGAGVPGDESKLELDRAMESLRRAVAAGYHPVAWMRRDPDLDSLRGRDDFKHLLLDLVFPVEPFAATE
jgi:eukaryotic-like serine/threonine-protein kinase